MARRSVAWVMCLVGVILPCLARAEPLAIWFANDPYSTQVVDHAPWQRFLDRYVAPDAQGIHRVDYAQARQHDRANLLSYLRSLREKDPRTLNSGEAKAFWINLYNAATVALVLEHPGKSSIRQMGRGWFARGPWDDPWVEVGDQVLTLNDIEHRILRPFWRDHRIHFAVNCASLGCPNLSRTAYAGTTLEAQLQDAEAAFLAHPRALRLAADGALHVSSLFDWYLEDFGGSRQALLDYLAAHHPQAEDIRNHRGRLRYHYDWQLNAFNHDTQRASESIPDHSE